MDDQTLMRRIAGGDERAFERLVQRYEAALGRFAVRTLGDVNLAADAVQDAFMHLWRSRRRYEHCGTLKAYLYKITLNACLDIRSSLPPIDLPDVGPLGSRPFRQESEVNSGAFADAVRDAVRSLPDGQSEVFVLSHYEQLSYTEIGQILGFPVGTVASRKRLAVETLRRKLAAWRDE